MKLLMLLQEERTRLIEEALGRLSHAMLAHYATSDSAENRDRLTRLFDLTQDCVRKRTLVPIMEYARRIASQRFEAGFGFEEVHVAFNNLEEVMWRAIVARGDEAELADALALVSSVLGAGKQALATQWVTLASHGKETQSPDASVLFGGLA
jgi:hypothetical protein